MDTLLKYLEKDFAPSQELWEKLLKAELKTEDISNKIFKKTLEGNVPTLSTSAAQTHLLNVRERWKKAAQTYLKLPADMAGALKEDLTSGVRLFFFEKSFLTQAQWSSIEASLNAFEKKQELKVYLLGQGQIKTNAQFSVIDDEHIVTGRRIHEWGGNNIQELGELTTQLISRLNNLPDVIYVGVFLDSHIFKNIAKIRAAKLLVKRVLEVSSLKKEIHVVGLTSFREWTLYERYANMLRNVASVASGYMGGADDVQSSGYQSLFQFETELKDPENESRSLRMARNTSHILALESMLGVVEDAAFGSYHMENLTEEYAKGGWEFMQKLEALPHYARINVLQEEAYKVRDEREKRVETRRHVMAGLNDFPDTNEVFKFKDKPKELFYRVGRSFEELRHKMEKTSQKPSVYIAIFGDYAALNTRINFIKNYFELLGLKVIDPGHGITAADVEARKEEIVVLCSSDEGYASLPEMKISAKDKYIAGKTERAGFMNLYAGQNVYQVLNDLLHRWSKP